MAVKITLGANAIPDELDYPVLGSYKVDGVRASIQDKRFLTRTLKEFPHKKLQLMNMSFFDLLDGELTVGCPNDSTTFSRTTSAVMSHDGVLTDLTFHVFDHIDNKIDFNGRYNMLKSFLNQRGVDVVEDAGVKINVRVIEQVVLHNPEEVYEYEAKALSEGWEGIVLRYPHKTYKHGRSTDKSGHLLRLKKFTDAEAEVLQIIELERNTNEATLSETGHTKRSSKKEGKIPAGTMGAIVVKDVVTGVEFKIGTGFDEKLRQEIFDNPSDWIGSLVKYKFFPKGVKDKPRFPVFIGKRSKLDLGG